VNRTEIWFLFLPDSFLLHRAASRNENPPIEPPSFSPILRRPSHLVGEHFLELDLDLRGPNFDGTRLCAAILSISRRRFLFPLLRRSSSARFAPSL